MINDGAASYLTLLLNGKFLELHIFVNNCILSYYYIAYPCSGPIGLVTMPCFLIGSHYLTLQTVLPHVELVLLACDIQNLRNHLWHTIFWIHTF